jgi:hypothetical protein
MALINSQTFYIDPNAVANATSVYLTSIDVYFQTKPAATNNTSGINNPQAYISISDTDPTGAPIFTSSYPNSLVALPYSSVVADSGAATPTTFTFAQPIPLQTGLRYSLNVLADDVKYTVWYAQSGDALVGSSTAVFEGFNGGIQGALYNYGSSGNITPVQNAQMKYVIRVAQFTQSSNTYQMVNQAYEFLNTGYQNGQFLGGEAVVPLAVNNQVQTLKFTGNTTIATGANTSNTFGAVTGQYAAIYANSSYLFVRKVVSANATSLTFDEPIPFINTTGASFFFTPIGNVFHNSQYGNVTILTNSTAVNSTFCFSTGNTFTGTAQSNSVQITGLSINTYTGGVFVGQPISANVTGFSSGTKITSIVNSSAINVSSSFTGTNTTGASILFTTLTPLIGTVSQSNAYINSVNTFPVSKIDSEIATFIPSGGNISFTYDLAYSNGSAYVVNTSLYANLTNNANNLVTKYNGLILSRSQEVSQSPNYLFSSNTKSAVIKATFTQNSSAGVFTAPFISTSGINMFIPVGGINNDATNENTDNGNAQCKHVTTTINFDSQYQPQDLMVQTAAFVPLGTSVLCYAKLYNSKDSDGFALKQWTQLYLVGGNSIPISTYQSNNYSTLTWGLPSVPPSKYTCNGTVTLASGTGVVTGVNTYFANSTTSGNVYAGQVVKIWNPLFPNNYIISTVANVTSNTSLTLHYTTTNTSIVGQSGFNIDLIQNSQLAFSNPQNGGIVRYYNSTNTEIDCYDSLKIKMVLLSNNINYVPRLAYLTAIGLSV